MSDSASSDAATPRDPRSLDEHVPTYVFAGGGTGGHLFPGIAVAEELQRRHSACRVVFVGSDRAIEQRIVPPAGFEHQVLPVATSTSFKRRPIRFVRKLRASYRAARKILQDVQPRAVIGLGGFASAPVGLAAWRLRIPLVLLEQNTVPGRATRLLSRFATAACLSFQQSSPFLSTRCRHELTGNPVRRKFQELCHRPSNDHKRTLLVLGGSQGSRAINDLVLSLVTSGEFDRAAWQLVHQTGDQDKARVNAAYQAANVVADVRAFIGDMHRCLAAAELVVARAGATTLAELACAGCPAVLIPFPKSVHNHQLLNAQHYESFGAAIVVEQSAPVDSFLQVVRQLLAEPAKLAEMRCQMTRLANPDGAKLVCDVVTEIERPSGKGA
ncbi:MAG: undecaprenyldiphospho-muramoylpentapeptide beta-N-acetylglucosaminyltransferase [Planctomycetota bacterium]|nr:undecaprenyldiphospho-muramoylpentapeptide beta-N-acetylglucosaminyltransferase [Planctomycetota bacterium]